jgi:hypothetical protein
MIFRKAMNQQGFRSLPKNMATILTFVRRKYCDYHQTPVTYE